MKSTITQKFQVHIPAAIRKQVGLRPNSQVRVHADGNRVIIEPVTSSIMDLAGSCKVDNPIPAEEVRQHIVYGEGK